MKVIEFCNEVMVISHSVTFWIMNHGPEYKAQYSVNMSFLEKQDGMGEPNIDSIIRSEGFVTSQEAVERLKEIMKQLKR